MPNTTSKGNLVCDPSALRSRGAIVPVIWRLFDGEIAVLAGEGEIYLATWTGGDYDIIDKSRCFVDSQ
jgi:hypothetical protein